MNMNQLFFKTKLYNKIKKSYQFMRKFPKIERYLNKDLRQANHEYEQSLKRSIFFKTTKSRNPSNP